MKHSIPRRAVASQHRRINYPLSIFSFFAMAMICAFAQETAPTSIPALPASTSTGFAWFMEHLKDFTAIAASIVLSARLIVKLTPTPADDSVLEKIVNFLKHVGLHID